MPSDFRIRAYVPADLPAFRRMALGLQQAECRMESNRAVWTDDGGAYSDWVLDEVAMHSGAIFMAESADGSAIGMVSCWRAEDATDITVRPEDRAHLYVGDIFVVESWRGRNVAGALLAAADAHGRSLGLATVTIGLLAVNQAAWRAYEKSGFEGYEVYLRKRL
ncbi:GNAT family N-acetyltransferase [Dongia sp.]|uniref:GNAT family N-acetyltransferase n=1 Tax=Dongia sp. TaxID=1977262 RepID=UPI0037505DAB